MHNEYIHYSQISKEAQKPRWRLCGVIRCPGIGLLIHNSTNEPYFESLLRVVFEAVFSSVVVFAFGRLRWRSLILLASWYQTALRLKHLFWSVVAVATHLKCFFSSVVVVVSGSRVFAVASSRLLNFQSLISNFDERGRWGNQGIV